MAWCSDCTRDAQGDANETFSAAVTACGSLVSGSVNHSGLPASPEDGKKKHLQSLPVEQVLSASRSGSSPAPEVPEQGTPSGRVEATSDLLAIRRDQDSRAMSADDFREMIRAATTLNESFRDTEPSGRLSAGDRYFRLPLAGLCLREKLARRVDEAIWRGFLLLLCSLVIIVVTLIIAVVVLGNQVGDELTIEESVSWVGTPNNLVDALRGQCVALKQQALPLIQTIEQYNREFGFREITFTTRSSLKQVAALFLPIENASARVVIVHGRGSHGLSSAAQTAGYILRQANISALIIASLAATRDHASAWPRDDDVVLGAWDYAVQDPAGLLGGALLPSKVGVMGFDFGGLAAQRAFAREPQVPALLVDGVVHNFEALMNAHVSRLLGDWSSTFLRDLLTDQVRSRCEMNLQTRLAEVSLPTGFVDRADMLSRLGVIRSLDDTFVPGDEQYELLVSSAAALQADALSLRWSASYAGPQSDSCHELRALHLSSPEEYRRHVCEFFTSALATDANCTR
mmetsp:Transcript_9338/g.22382  ORF Transcript_9338/g.22382 Transcript_9338/m.22382 type:complete len:516 (+) Transcript_9338:109-1656(+)